MATYTQREPHTSQWFEQNLVRFPQRTQNTMKVITAMHGDRAVCSMCGDSPASNYQLATDSTNTWKFCNDCLHIRKTVHREGWVPMQPGEREP